MHYVIVRDDDTSALTPTECLERLYRPLLGRGHPVCLSTIPEVNLGTRTPEGAPEGFLPKTSATDGTAPIGGNQRLLHYLRSEPGYRIVQHGFRHDPYEFGISSRSEIVQRLERGASRLKEAGLDPEPAFVAPHDRFSREAIRQAAARFPVISSGWFESRRLPFDWWPAYAVRRARSRPHWTAGGAILLSHPGCLLSYRKPYGDMARTVSRAVRSASLTVLVTHWWEYFRDGKADEPFIAALHEVSEWLSAAPDVRVVSFRDVAQGRVPLN